MSLSETQCPSCKGRGTVPCDACKDGSAWNLTRPDADEMDPDSWEVGDCIKCLGEGEIPCSECRGAKKVLANLDAIPAFAAN